MWPLVSHVEAQTIASFAGGGVRRLRGKKIYIYIYIPCWPSPSISSWISLWLHWKGSIAPSLRNAVLKGLSPVSVFKACLLLHGPPANAKLLKGEHKINFQGKEKAKWREGTVPICLGLTDTFTGIKLAWQSRDREHKLQMIQSATDHYPRL